MFDYRTAPSELKEWLFLDISEERFRQILSHKRVRALLKSFSEGRQKDKNNRNILFKALRALMEEEEFAQFLRGVWLEQYIPLASIAETFEKETLPQKIMELKDSWGVPRLFFVLFFARRFELNRAANTLAAEAAQNINLPDPYHHAKKDEQARLRDSGRFSTDSPDQQKNRDRDIVAGKLRSLESENIALKKQDKQNRIKIHRMETLSENSDSKALRNLAGKQVTEIEKLRKQIRHLETQLKENEQKTSDEEKQESEKSGINKISPRASLRAEDKIAKIELSLLYNHFKLYLNKQTAKQENTRAVNSLKIHKILYIDTADSGRPFFEAAQANGYQAFYARNNDLKGILKNAEIADLIVVRCKVEEITSKGRAIFSQNQVFDLSLLDKELFNFFCKDAHFLVDTWAKEKLFV